ncbi:HIT family protein [Nonomuraea sp. ATR24]|uniref:HIT family protein n=1 Tax=Nonomuraea sp. ATR24 TaxID=1676744 RepID=UPI0035C24DE3
MSADEPCVFCAIIAGRTEAGIVHADETVVAILDHQPATPGHVLVIPRRHIPSLAETDDATGAAIWRAARRIATALRRSGLRCDGIRLSLADGEAAGQEVFHLHLHVVPRFPGDGVTVTADWKKRPRELLDQDAARIRNALP